jgi:hypothetical protein
LSLQIQSLFLALAFLGQTIVKKRAEILDYVTFLSVFALCTGGTIKNIRAMK